MRQQVDDEHDSTRERKKQQPTIKKCTYCSSRSTQELCDTCITLKCDAHRQLHDSGWVLIRNAVHIEDDVLADIKDKTSFKTIFNGYESEK